MTNKQTRFRRRGRKSRQQPTAEGEEGYDPYDFSKSETEGEEGRDQSPCVGHYFLTAVWNLGWSVLGKHSLWKFGKNGISFSRPWKCENWVGSVKVWEFCGLQSAREKLLAYQSETALPKTEQQFKRKNLRCEIRTNFLPVFFDRVHWLQ